MKRIVLFITGACVQFCWLGLGCAPKHTPKPQPAITETPTQKIVRVNPKLGAYALLPRLSPEQADILGRYFEVVITGAEDEVNNPEMLDRIHQIRPDIVQLPYLSLEQFPEGQMDNNEPINGPVHQLHSQITPEMWLYKENGQRLSNWPGSYLLNLTTKPWRDLVIASIRDRTFARHPTWHQGVYFDDVWWEIAWSSSEIDADQDGRADLPGTLNNQWFSGVADLFYQLRKTCPDAIVISQNGAYFPSNRMEQVNGVFFEDTLKENNDLNRVISKLRDAMSHCRDPKLTIINVCGEENDLEKMRSGLALAAIFGAHYFYDLSVQCHCTLWTYREYERDLGRATEEPVKTTEGVWCRHFENGFCLFNPTPKPQLCIFKQSLWNADGEEYNGAKMIPPRSGLVLYPHP